LALHIAKKGHLLEIQSASSSHHISLVGGEITILKNMSSSAGMMTTFPTEWKVRKVMFQTTNQFINANGQRISMAS
jgi:hypothetical protein